MSKYCSTCLTYLSDDKTNICRICGARITKSDYEPTRVKSTKTPSKKSIFSPLPVAITTVVVILLVLVSVQKGKENEESLKSGRKIVKSFISKSVNSVKK